MVVVGGVVVVVAGILEDLLENAALSVTACRHVALVVVVVVVVVAAVVVAAVGVVDVVGVVSLAGVRSNCKICKPERE